jgi:hypothetical protein
MEWTGPAVACGDSLQRLRRSTRKSCPWIPPLHPLASIGIDIGKEVFHIVGFNTDGNIAPKASLPLRLNLVQLVEGLKDERISRSDVRS